MDVSLKFFTIVFICTLLTIFYSCSSQRIQKKYAQINRINKDLIAITKTTKSRNHLNIETLDSVANYIYHEFSSNCDSVFFQEYSVNGKKYRNVIGSLGLINKERIIIGAHYDVCENQEGADDNASGVTGLLELSRLLKGDTLKYRIDFVAYTLEEPPYFRTEKMGSFVHAKYLHDNNIPVKGMICLEMIGYYSDEDNSQEYPVNLLKLFYGTKGNYITIIQKFSNGSFGRKFCQLMKKQDLIETKSLRAPAFVTGIDFSDHLNYWKFGYSAVMVTNTAFYRNKNYHQKTDTLETLNLEKMTKVIDEIYRTILNL